MSTLASPDPTLSGHTDGACGPNSSDGSGMGRTEMTGKPLAIDLFCGLGGWTEGLLAEGYDVIGFDIEQHVYGEHRYPAQLVIQDVLTLHGSQFRDAALIVASPPCQEYSYMAMPWKLAKAKAAAIRADETGEALAKLTQLFDACFHIQAQASMAAGRRIPLIVENVKGAQPWVGRARAHFGSFYFWGDVPALMPSGAAFKSKGMDWKHPDDPRHRPGQDFTWTAGNHAGLKNGGGSWFKVAHNKASGHGQNPDGRLLKRDPVASCVSGSRKRRHAQAMIAKIPIEVSRHIGATFKAANGV